MAHVSVIEERLARIEEDLRDYFSPNKLYDFNPVFDYPLTVASGVDIRGEFQTTSDSPDPTYSYITLMRQGDTIASYDGYGIAWTPGDGSTYNVYITDQNALYTNVFTSQNIIMPQLYNNFLAAGKVAIVAEQWYKYRITIDTNFAMKVWIWQTTDTPDGGFTDLTKIVSVGPFYHTYTPNATGNRFGFSVFGTKNCEWLYRNLVIYQLNPSYPVEYYKMLNPVSLGEPFKIKYYGYAEDDENPGELTGVQLWIYNFTDLAWEYSSANAGVIPDTNNEILVTFSSNPTDYISEDGYIWTAVYPSTPNPSNSCTLHTNYICVESIPPSGVDAGGALDVYVDDRSKVVDTLSSKTVSGNMVSLSTDLGDTLPFLDVIDIFYNGAPLQRGYDYSIQRDTSGLAFSTREEIDILFNLAFEGLQVDIQYMAYSMGTTLQNTVSNSEAYLPNADILIKHKIPAIISLGTFSVQTTLTETELLEKIKTYINSLTTIYTEAGLLSHLLVNGVTSIDVSNLDISIRKFAVEGSNTEYTNPSSVTLESYQAFVFNQSGTNIAFL